MIFVDGRKKHFLLITSKVVYVLSTSQPEVIKNETLDQTRRHSKWENDDYICCGHILNENDKGKGQSNVGQPSVHMVEDKNKKDNNNKGIGKKCKYDSPDKTNKKSKELVCWRCQKVGHMKRDCCVKLGKNGARKDGSG
ncbi:zinc finger, CCHC-type containing protein [Tanacetum coccineum]